MRTLSCTSLTNQVLDVAVFQSAIPMSDKQATSESVDDMDDLIAAHERFSSTCCEYPAKRRIRSEPNWERNK